MTLRIEPFFFFWKRKKNDSQDLFLKKQRTFFFFWIWLTSLNFFWIRLTELNIFGIRLKELNPLFLEYDAKNWTVWFLKMTHRIEPFFVTQRIGTFFCIWLKELNFLYDSQNCFFSISTHRIELFLEHGSRNWTFFFKKKWF